MTAIIILPIIIFLIDASAIAARSKPHAENEITVPLSDRVYKIWNGYELNWKDALKLCEAKNMKLLSIESVEKFELLGEFLKKNDFFHKPGENGNRFVYWTSGNDLKTPASFVWETTGEKFTYTNWLHGNPDNFENREHCMAIGSLEFGKWNDVNCRSKLDFICEDFTFDHKLGSDYIFWTSGNDLKTEGTFVWESTGAQMEFTNWEVGMPDNWRSDEHCLEMGYRRLSMWNDNRCWYKRHLICEAKITISVRNI